MPNSRRKLLLALPVAALLVASCDGASATEEAEVVEAAMMAQPVATAAPAAPVEKIVVREIPVAVEKVVEVEKVVPAQPAAEAQAASAPQADAGAAIARSERRVIRTASIGIVVADVAESVRVVRSLVTAIPGAFVAHTDVRGDDPYAISSLTVRVPVDRFDETIERIRAHGSKVVAEDVTGRDVTAEFTDLEARLRNAQAAERQLLEIMERAETVEDILAVQRELAAVREQIERFQGQLNVLASQTELSTITVYLHPAPDLRVERRMPDQYAMHQSVIFPITVANQGTVELRRIEVHDRLARDMIFEQASPPGVYDPGAHRVVWSIDRLGAGESREVWFRARLEGDGATMQLTAGASTESLVRDADEDRAEAMLPFFVDLSVVKDGETAVPLGREAAYFLSFRNRGNGDARDVRLVERLPEGMTFVRADGGGELRRQPACRGLDPPAAPARRRGRRELRGEGRPGRRAAADRDLDLLRRRGPGGRGQPRRDLPDRASRGSHRPRSLEPRHDRPRFRGRLVGDRTLGGQRRHRGRHRRGSNHGRRHGAGAGRLGNPPPRQTATRRPTASRDRLSRADLIRSLHLGILSLWERVGERVSSFNPSGTPARSPPRTQSGIGIRRAGRCITTASAASARTRPAAPPWNTR